VEKNGGKGHKCPDKVSLQVLEEVLDVLQPEPTADHSSDSSTKEDEAFSLSHQAAVGIQGRKTIKLTGKVNNQEILILIDSGSSCTFLSDKAVQALNC
jgi:hypothetical protein